MHRTDVGPIAITSNTPSEPPAFAQTKPCGSRCARLRGGVYQRNCTSRGGRMKASSLALLCLCFLPGPCSAASIRPAEDESATMDELFGGASLTFGDKLFFDWEVVENRSTSSADPLQTIVSAIGVR